MTSFVLRPAGNWMQTEAPTPWRGVLSTRNGYKCQLSLEGMQRQPRRLIILLIIIVPAISASFAEEQTPVKSTGETTMAAKYPSMVIQVKIGTHEVDIGKPSNGHPDIIRSNCTYSRYPCSIVDYIDISVNRKPLFVPRSVFSDLADLNQAMIRADKDGAILILNGGDASESYILKVSFNAENIKSRTLVDGEFDEVMQKTTYFQDVH
jgi:hypothetical protein